MSAFVTVFKIFFLNCILLALYSCGDGGIDGGGAITDVSDVPDTGDTSVIISGKVSLSGSSVLKSSQKSSGPQAPSGQPGSKMYMATRQEVMEQKDDNFLTLNKEVNSASVFLYDADHPEWLYPVASASTNTNGDYTLNILSNAEYNLDSNGNTIYVNGDPIPEGQYTLLAFRPGGFDPVLGVTTDPVVAIQTVVNTFSAGVVSTADLRAQSSTVKPIVETMFGVRKNTDGTQTWSGPADIAPNEAIQITFSMAMSRASILNGISISPEVAGNWTVSADWMSATFYPDSTTGLAPGSYSIAVNGENGTGFPVTNVYGNSLAKTALGSFTVIAGDDSTVPVVALASPATTTGVDIVTPIRVSSDEVLDINSLSIASTPSLGAKPGVMFVGKNTSNQYIYEFVLANPLALGTSYSINISGGTDMAGNVMAALPVSFTTISTVTGVDGAADAATQAVQAEVLDVFGRWVRAFNDRSLRQLQSMMSGDYVFEYDVSQHGPNDEDLNRDGRLSLQEFSTMIAEGFKHWDFCGTSVTGEVIGNVNVVGSSANFEFRLTFTSPTNTSQDCTDDSPNALFATANNINGSWLIERVSEGIDTRNRVLKPRALLSGLAMTQNDVSIGSEAVGNLNGASLIVLPTRNAGVVDYPVSFSWSAVEGATAYVFYIVNARDEDRGRAFILPSANTSWKMPRDKDGSGKAILAPGVIDVQKLFGFWNDQGIGMVREGEEFYWTVMAIDNNVPSDFDVDGNGSYDPQNLSDESRATSLFQQISAVSRQYRYKNPGVYKEMSVSISSPTYGALTFNEWYGGYDAIDDASIDLVVNTPNLDAGNSNFPSVYVNGHSWKQIPITFDASGNVTVNVPLFSGFNWIDINDGLDLYKNFSVQTTGGTAPVIQNILITDQNSNTYTPDAWGYVDTGGADITSITIAGVLVDALIGPSLTTNNFNVNLWNESGANSNQNLTNVTDNFSVQLPVYQGNNWINMDINYCDTATGALCDYANFHLGVYTSTGKPYTPPIHTIAVTGATKTDDYGNSQNWDASSDTDNSLVISGIMEFTTGGTTPTYNISSDGAWFSNNLILNSDGSFQIPVSLYNGWNYVDMYDADGNWFNVAIYTSAGQAVLRPKVLTLSNSSGAVNYNGSGGFNTDVCSLDITGLALAETQVEVSWNGGDGTSYFNERVFTLSGADGDGDGLGSFSATIPLVGGAGTYNNVDVFDVNYRGVYVQVNTSAACAYLPPVLTMTDITGSASATSSFPLGGDYLAAGSTTVTVTGNSSDTSGRKIVGTNWGCGGAEKVETTADGSGDWTLVMNVYQDYNNLEVTDGVNYEYVNVQTSNGVYPVLKMTAGVQGQVASYDGCGFSQYNLSTETSAVITGATTAQDGTGQYWDADGVMQSFDIAGGVFSFTVANLYDGGNFISIDDTEFNHYNVDIFTSNGVIRPRYVEITSHSHGEVVSPATITISGVIDIANFTADRVNGYVYDECTGTSYEYSSDNYEVTTLGKSPIVFTPGGSTFSFDFDVTANTCFTEFSVDGGNDTNFEWHGHRITINNVYNYGEYSYKNGAGTITKQKSGVLRGEANISPAIHSNAVRSLIKARRKY